jgi:hypothetical protein
VLRVLVAAQDADSLDTVIRHDVLGDFDWFVVCSGGAGFLGFHFHDLRHTGNTLAAGTGASLADLMARMGHGYARAALIYQHAITQRDAMIADALSLSIDLERDQARNGHDTADWSINAEAQAGESPL